MKKKHKKVKLELLFYLSYNSHFSHIKNFILSWPPIYNCSSHIFSIQWNVLPQMWLNTARNRHFRLSLRCWGLFFQNETKITSYQSTSSEILMYVKGCKETNSRALHTNNIWNYFFKIYNCLKKSKQVDLLNHITPWIARDISDKSWENRFYGRLYWWKRLKIKLSN